MDGLQGYLSVTRPSYAHIFFLVHQVRGWYCNRSNWTVHFPCSRFRACILTWPWWYVLLRDAHRPCCLRSVSFHNLCARCAWRDPAADDLSLKGSRLFAPRSGRVVKLSRKVRSCLVSRGDLTVFSLFLYFSPFSKSTVLIALSDRVLRGWLCSIPVGQ